MELAFDVDAGGPKLDVVLRGPRRPLLLHHADPLEYPFPEGFSRGLPIPIDVQTPERHPSPEPEDDWLDEPVPRPMRPVAEVWSWGGRLTWLSGLLLAVSAFTDWYAGSGEGPTVGVIGWHTGVLGKLVFFIGLAVLALVALREAGFELPASVPESLVVIALGSLATIFVMIRLISVPDEFFGTRGRGIGIFISLIAALLVTVAGLLRASEEL